MSDRSCVEIAVRPLLPSGRRFAEEPLVTQLLLEKFGSVTRLRNADTEAIAALPGISKKTAESILEFLNEMA